MQKDLQRIDVKVFVHCDGELNLDPILTPFDRWRQVEDAPSDWVDLADYAHMPQGPGVMMAGKREHFLVDANKPGLGLLLQTRGELQGSPRERFLEAFRRHLQLATALLAEREWPSNLTVRTGDWSVTINDRLQFPDDEGTDRELLSGLEAALDQLLGAGGYQLTRRSEPGGRYGYRVQAEAAPDLAGLLASGKLTPDPAPASD